MLMVSIDSVTWQPKSTLEVLILTFNVCEVSETFVSWAFDAVVCIMNVEDKPINILLGLFDFRFCDQLLTVDISDFIFLST